MNDAIKVLDKGFVRLEAFAGGDEAVLRSARVSYGSESTDEARDKKLIAYLLDNEHGSPFEHTFFTFHVKLPILCARQWVRHRVGVSLNEVSARYTEMKDDFYSPQVYRTQDLKNKQGSVTSLVIDHEKAKAIVDAANFEAYTKYQHLLAIGVAREMARMVLPVSIFTEWYFSCNARSLMTFIGLRSDAHAQAETRQYSHAMASIFKQKMPWTFSAFEGSLRKKTNRNYDELFAYLDPSVEK